MTDFITRGADELPPRSDNSGARTANQWTVGDTNDILDALMDLRTAAAATSYGETFEFNEAGSTITITSTSTAYRWITGGAGTVKGTGYVTWDNAAAPTGKRLTIGASGAGKYLVTATFAGNLQKHADISMDVYKNAAAATNITCDFHVTEDGAYVSGAASGLLDLAVGDTVTMWFSASIGTNAFTLKHANLSLVRIAL
jgi:hypothetical protein